MYFHRSIIAMSLVAVLISLSIMNPMEIGPLSYVDGEYTDDEIKFSGDWDVTGAESYFNDNITLDGNLTISGTLILDGVSLMVNGSDPDPYVISVMSGGVLICRNNTVITGVNESEYRFTAASGSMVTMNKTLLFNCGVSSPSSPHSWKGPYSMTDSLFLLDTMISGSPFGLIVDGGKLTALNLTITMVDHCGISLENGSIANITGMDMIGNNGYGIISRASTLNLHGSMINSINSSLLAEGSTFRLDGSTLSSQVRGCRSISSTGTAVDSVIMAGNSHSFSLETPSMIPSTVSVLNTTLGSVSVNDPTGWLQESYRTDFRVVTNGNAPAAGAGLTVQNNQGNVVHDSILGPQGSLDDLPLEAFLHNVTGSHDRSPYDLIATLNGVSRRVNFTLPMLVPVHVTIILDTPSISFISPEEGQWLNSNDLLFSCVIEDHGELESVKLVIDGKPPVNMGAIKDVRLDLSLEEGAHKIEVMATDLDGFSGSSMVNFSVDSIAPTIGVSQPTDGDVVNDTTIWIKGTCSPDAYLYLNDVSTMIVDGRFNTTFHLSEGRNQITLFAIDRAGNSDTFQFTVYRDSTPPYLHIDAPMDGITTANRELRVKGYTDQSTVRLTVNGEDVAVENGAFDHGLTTLVEGENRIVITAFDRTGSMTTTIRRVTLDTTPPSIFLTHSPAVVGEDVVVIKGLIEPNAILTIDGWLYDVVDGEFTAEIDYLSEGSNVLLLRAEDFMGNFALLEYKVYLDKTPPEIVSINPPLNSHVSNPIQVITGEAYDDIGVSRIMGRFEGGTFTDLEGIDSWKWVVTLELGANVLQIRALDAVGNERSVQLTYNLDITEIVDVTPPTVTITEPGNNTILDEEGLVNFEGTAYDNWEVSSVEARIDNGEWIPLEGRSLWHVTFNLTSGNHKMDVKVVDTSGNVGYTYIVVRVILHAEDVSESDKISPSLPLIILMIFVLLLAVVFGFLLYNNRKLKKIYDEIEGTQEEARASRRSGMRPGREMREQGREMPTARRGERSSVRDRP